MKKTRLTLIIVAVLAFFAGTTTPANAKLQLQPKTSLNDYLLANGKEPTRAVKKKLAEDAGIKNYRRTEKQNMLILRKLKEAAGAELQPKTSLVDFLKSQGEPSDYEARTARAEKAGIENYGGTAKQNIALLKLLIEASKRVATSETPTELQPPTVQVPVQVPVPAEVPLITEEKVAVEKMTTVTPPPTQAQITPPTEEVIVTTVAPEETVQPRMETPPPFTTEDKRIVTGRKIPALLSILYLVITIVVAAGLLGWFILKIRKPKKEEPKDADLAELTAIQEEEQREVISAPAATPVEEPVDIDEVRPVIQDPKATQKIALPLPNNKDEREELAVKAAKKQTVRIILPDTPAKPVEEPVVPAPETTRKEKFHFNLPVRLTPMATPPPTQRSGEVQRETWLKLFLERLSPVFIEPIEPLTDEDLDYLESHQDKSTDPAKIKEFLEEQRGKAAATA